MYSYSPVATAVTPVLKLPNLHGTISTQIHPLLPVLIRPHPWITVALAYRIRCCGGGGCWQLQVI